MPKLCLLVGLLVASLSGCSSVSQYSQNNQMGNLLLAEPLPPSSRSQLAIARYNQILSQAPLEDEERAELFYQRGMLYDSLGLSGLARFDFQRAISLKPDMAEAHNSLGIHYTQQMEFIRAYESFDSTLDIDPDYDFAFLNRGIALYYGGRPDLAAQDFARFHTNTDNDPYRALWAFIAQREVDESAALIELAEARQSLSEQNWATTLVDLYLGKVSESKVLSSLILGVRSQRQLTDRLCEAYFYLGKYHSSLGNRGVASNYFKLALSTNVFEYVEHRYARLELDLLSDKRRSD